MFLKLWKQEFSPRKILLSHNKPEQFTKCYFQKSKKVSRLWIGYHSLMTFYFIITFIYTVTPQMHEDNDQVLDKYFIFLTHWTYIFETCYFIVGLIVVITAALRDDIETISTSPSSGIIRKEMTWYLKIYWVMHTTVAPAIFGITIVFWAFIYSPEKFKIDGNNLLHHGFNSIFMLLHIILIDHPVRILHVYMPLLYGLLYIIFSIIYQASGGTGIKGSIPIYTILDWRNPGITVVVCILCTLLLVILHMIFFTFYFVKSYLKKSKKVEKVETFENKIV